MGNSGIGSEIVNQLEDLNINFLGAVRIVRAALPRLKQAENGASKRVGQSSDQANAAVFLLNDQSSWMTGQVLHVDGGMSTIRMFL